MPRYILLLSLLLVSFSQSAIVETLSKRLLKTDQSVGPVTPQLLYVLSEDGTVQAYDTESTKAPASIKAFIKNGVSMTVSADGNNVFVSGQDEEYNYNLKQIDTKTFNIVFDFINYAGDNELPMVASNDNKLLITGNDVGGNDARVKLWDIKEEKFLEEHPWGFNYDIGMTALALTSDNKMQYVGSEYCDLQEFDLTNKAWTHNYSKDSKIDEDSNINSMFITSDDKYLFLSNDQGYVKQFDIKKKELFKNWGIVTNGQINKMIYHSVSDTFFTSDSPAYGKTGPFGVLKQFNIKTQELVKDYGVIVKGGIIDMAMNRAADKLFIAGDENIVVLDIQSGKIIHDIKSASKIVAIGL